MADLAAFLLTLFPVSLLGLACLLLLWIAFAALRVLRQRPIPRWLPSSTYVLLALALATYLYPTRPAFLRGRQVRTLADMQTVRTFLSRYRETSGAYPHDLAAAVPQRYRSILVDVWGSPLVYQTRGDAYILVSYGKGRKPDGLDYWKLRDSGAPDVIVAGEWDADQVASDLGWHRSAGK